MISFSAFSQQLAQKMSTGALPGMDAQLNMAPETRKVELRKKADTDTRHSAVLMLFFPKNEQVHLVMIKRAADNSVHSNQIAFPGGKHEKEDISLMHTALRETHEEIGIHPSEVKILGQLTDLYIPPSNFMVTPFVGMMEKEPVFTPNEEVERVLVIPLSDLINPKNTTEKTIQTRMGEWIVPCYTLDGEIVWGASAMMLAEWLELFYQGSSK